MKDLLVVEQVFIYIFFVIILFSSFIYNEVIIINVCNLNKNTTKNISKRQLFETEETVINLRDIENDLNNEGKNKPILEE